MLDRTSETIGSAAADLAEQNTASVDARIASPPPTGTGHIDSWPTDGQAAIAAEAAAVMLGLTRVLTRASPADGREPRNACRCSRDRPIAPRRAPVARPPRRRPRPQDPHHMARRLNAARPSRPAQPRTESTHHRTPAGRRPPPERGLRDKRDRRTLRGSTPPERTTATTRTRRTTYEPCSCQHPHVVQPDPSPRWVAKAIGAPLVLLSFRPTRTCPSSPRGSAPSPPS